MIHVPDETRERLALGSAAFAVSGALTYAAIRGWVYLRGGGGGLVLLLRQQTIGYFHALAVSTVVAISVALAVVTFTDEPRSLRAVERLLLRGAAPALALAAIADFLLP